MTANHESTSSAVRATAAQRGGEPVRRRPAARRRAGSAPGAVLCGVAAALAAPWYVDGPRLKRLLAASDGAGGRGDGRAAVRWANRALRVLARLPGTRWRNTCLYRAVAGCLAMRWLGLEATVRIGARRDAAQDRVLAHAWIDPSPRGSADAAGAAAYRVLSGRAGAEP
ncbi:MAG TPA: lasso peptide biosynthesis B2 protein [Longimicrobiales bacterium]